MKKILSAVMICVLSASPAFAGPDGRFFQPRPPHHTRPMVVRHHHGNVGSYIVSGLVGGVVGSLLAGSVSYVVQPAPQPPTPQPVYVPSYNSGVTCTTTVVNGVATQSCTSQPVVVNSSTVYY